MLEGKKIRLRLAEKEDAQMLTHWFNDAEFAGEYQHFPVQISASLLEKQTTEHRLFGQEWVDSAR